MLLSDCSEENLFKKKEDAAKSLIENFKEKPSDYDIQKLNNYLFHCDNYIKHVNVDKRSPNSENILIAEKILCLKQRIDGVGIFRRQDCCTDYLDA